MVKQVCEKRQLYDAYCTTRTVRLVRFTVRTVGRGSGDECAHAPIPTIQLRARDGARASGL